AAGLAAQAPAEMESPAPCSWDVHDARTAGDGDHRLDRVEWVSLDRETRGSAFRHPKNLVVGSVHARAATSYQFGCKQVSDGVAASPQGPRDPPGGLRMVPAALSPGRGQCICEHGASTATRIGVRGNARCWVYASRRCRS